MTRQNLAVCFSPVIFRFSLEKKTYYKPPNVRDTTNRSASSQVGQTSSAPLPTTTTMSESAHNNSNISQVAATISTLNKNDSNSNVTGLVTSIPQDSQQQQQQQASKPTTNTTNATNQANDMDNTSSTNETVTASDSRKNSESESLPVVNNNDNNKQSVELNIPTKEVQANNNKKSSQVVSFTELSSSTSSTTAMGGSTTTTSQTGKDKLNYKRKYSEKINRAASSIVNFGAELSSSKPTAFFSDSFKENLENMSKVIQLCVSDMIKYSMDLFTVS